MHEPTLDAGFAIVENVLTSSQCNNLLAGLAIVPQGRAGARHLMRCAEIAALANDEGLVSLARQAMASQEAVPYRATLFTKTGQSNWLVAWQQDTALSLTERFEADGWAALGELGYEPVRMVAIDEDRSALRFRHVEFIKLMQRNERMVLSAAGKEKITRKTP